MDELRRFVEDLLRAAGCDIGVARATADVFVEADLHGFDFQGLDHLPTVLKEIRAGKVRPEARPVVRAREGSTAIVNARRAPGPIAAVRAADVAIETASRAGCAAVGVVDSNALYMLGYYAERIARSRLIGIVLTTGRALVRPFGGVERVLATNPLAMAVPRPGPHPSSGDGDQLPRRRPRPPGRLSRGDASRRDRRRPGRASLPERCNGPGRGDLADGGPQGLRPLARDRAGRRSVSRRGCGQGPRRPAGVVRLAGPALPIDPEAFGREDAFLGAVEGYLQEVKSSRRAPDVDEIRFPGERAFAERDRRLREGIPIQEVVLARLEPWAAELRVPMIGGD